MNCAPLHVATLRLALPCFAAALFAAPLARAWETFEDDQPTDSLYHLNAPYPWVYFDVNYGQPGHGAYKGVWRQINQWPDQGASVNIRHQVNLSNAPYNPTGVPGGEVIPFPDTLGGYLEVNSFNLEPGGAVYSSLEIFSFDGASTWNGGFVSAGNFSRPDGSGGRGRLRNKGIVTVTGSSVIGRVGEFYNTNRVLVEPGQALGVHAGNYGFFNESGIMPDTSFAEVELRGEGSSLIIADGGGGGFPILYNYGVIRKSGPGTSIIAHSVTNHTDSDRNRAGTIAVNSGTLRFESEYAEHTWHGAKAEVAPGALLALKGSHSLGNGNFAVSGGGIVRLESIPAGTYFRAVAGASPTLTAPEGKFECAGAIMRDITNLGSINVTAYSVWNGMVNKGHVRLLADLYPQTTLTNGAADNRSAVLDLEGTAGVQAGQDLRNYAHLRKIGSGTSTIATNLVIYGADGDPLAGRVEVLGGTLNAAATVIVDKGAHYRVANGSTLELNYRNYLNNSAVVTITGSGKVSLKSGGMLSTETPDAPATFNAAPGTLSLEGGTFYGPANNTGTITVASSTVVTHSALQGSPIQNTGTLHLTATSAAASGYSMSVGGLAWIVCAPGSVLAMDIAGRPSETNKWASLVYGGPGGMTYGGTLRINFADFDPASGDRWQIITNNTGTPTATDFAKVEFTNVPAGFTPVSEKTAGGFRVGLDASSAPVSYAEWTAAQNFPAPAAAGFDADPDGDGISNGIECALGTNPQASGSQPGMSASLENRGGDVFLTAEFKRPGGALRATDLKYIAERTDGLGGWTTDGVVVEVGPLDAQSNETLRVRPVEPMSFKNRTFVRLRVEKM